MTIENIFDRTSPEPMSGCWIWTGAHNRDDLYGNLTHEGKRWMSHRWFYTYLHGAIPENMTLDHKCRNHTCVNPAHLEPVTSQINTLRGVGVTARNAIKTHCKHGHEFTPSNIKKVKGGKACRACNVAATRKWRQQN